MLVCGFCETAEWETSNRKDCHQYENIKSHSPNIGTEDDYTEGDGEGDEGSPAGARLWSPFQSQKGREKLVHSYNSWPFSIFYNKRMFLN